MIGRGEPIGREEAGLRPAVVVSADRLNESPAGVVIVVPCTTTYRGLPSNVELDPGTSGLDVVSYAKCEEVKSVPDQLLLARLGTANDEALFELSRALKLLLDP